MDQHDVPGRQAEPPQAGDNVGLGHDGGTVLLIYFHAAILHRPVFRHYAAHAVGDGPGGVGGRRVPGEADPDVRQAGQRRRTCFPLAPGGRHSRVCKPIRLSRSELNARSLVRFRVLPLLFAWIGSAEQ